MTKLDAIGPAMSGSFCGKISLEHVQVGDKSALDRALAAVASRPIPLPVKRFNFLSERELSEVEEKLLKQATRGRR